MYLRKMWFSGLVFVQMFAAACANLPGMDVSAVKQARLHIAWLQQPAAYMVQSVDAITHFTKQAPDVPWALVMPVMMLPVNVLIWWMLMQWMGSKLPMRRA